MMIYILGLVVLFLLMAVLGNIAVEGIFAIKEKRKPNFIKAFRDN